MVELLTTIWEVERCDSVKMPNLLFWLLLNSFQELCCSHAPSFSGCMENDEEEILAGHFLMQFNATVVNYRGAPFAQMI